MQPLGLTERQRDAYHARLFGSHDYDIEVEVLTLNEVPTGSVRFLDGQVNLQPRDSAVRRTATLTVSDPAGALDFNGTSAWSGGTVWVDRLIRVRHTIRVPELGRSITVTPFIGPPSAMSRSGAEVSIECQDKTALAIRGASPLTLPKGMNAVKAIRKVLADRTGEFRFRLGTAARRLSRNYVVGWDDTTSPWAVASAIAQRELGMQLLYSCDGYATLRKMPKAVSLVVPHVTELPASSVDFTGLANYVQVAGKQKSKTKGNVTRTEQPIATAVVKSGNLAPAALARKGVARYLPLLVTSDEATQEAQVRARAADELDRAARLQDEPALTCVPFFHADSDDLLRFAVPGNDVDLRLESASIPLGPAEMSVGAVRWVSRAPRRRVSTRTVRTVKREKKNTTKKGRK